MLEPMKERCANSIINNIVMVVKTGNINSLSKDAYDFICHATGYVLINGLGLGVALINILKKSDIKHIDVIEILSDVLNLISSHINDNRVNFINADALKYFPDNGVRYNAVWHDIWDGICSDNLRDMAKLKRRYSKICDWQGCWCETECRRNKRRGR